MKMKFEEFKNILNDGEEAYDSKAWDSLVSKLDNKTKSTSKTKVSNTALFSTFALLSIVAIVFFVSNSSEKSKNKVEISKNENKSSVKKQINSNSNIEKNNNPIQINAISNLENDIKIQQFEKIAEDYSTILKTLSIENVIEKNNEKQEKIEITEEFKLPKFKQAYCIDDEIEIQNSNSQKIFILNENDEFVAILNENDAKKIKLKFTGNHKLMNGSKEIVSENIFTVKAKKQLDFSFENEINYEKGIPYILLNSTTFSQNSNWKSDKGLILNQNENTKLRVFQKGNYFVKLSETDENSCFSEIVKQISIEENYNLMAPNAFIPLDIDSRNNRFMPRALVLRDVVFDLIIIDPKTSKVVFKSNSHENSWDGIDITTGELVPFNKSFIWKATLKNPEIGEKSEYTGTIVRL